MLCVLVCECIVFQCVAACAVVCCSALPCVQHVVQSTLIVACANVSDCMC